MNCLICKAKYHHCSSCGAYGLEENLLAEGFCSIDCWQESTEFKGLMESATPVVEACIKAGVYEHLADIIQECGDYLCFAVFAAYAGSEGYPDVDQHQGNEDQNSPVVETPSADAEGAD
jgi:hypothetical protein